MMMGGKPQANPLPEPRFVESGPLLLAGLVERHRDSNSGIPAQWQRFAAECGRLPGPVDGAAYGVVFDAAQSGMDFSYLTGIEVNHRKNLPDSFERLEIPARQYAVFAHSGHVSTLPQTMQSIWQDWLPRSGVRPDSGRVSFFERYGEEFDPASGTGGFEIWFPVTA